MRAGRKGEPGTGKVETALRTNIPVSGPPFHYHCVLNLPLFRSPVPLFSPYPFFPFNNNPTQVRRMRK